MGVFRQSSLRVLAPASLVVFAIVLLIVVIASISGGDDSSSTQSERVTITEPAKRDRARLLELPAGVRPAAEHVELDGQLITTDRPA